MCVFINKEQQENSLKEKKNTPKNRQLNKKPSIKRTIFNIYNQLANHRKDTNITLFWLRDNFNITSIGIRACIYYIR